MIENWRFMGVAPLRHFLNLQSSIFNLQSPIFNRQSSIDSLCHFDQNNPRSIKNRLLSGWSFSWSEWFFISWIVRPMMSILSSTSEMISVGSTNGRLSSVALGPVYRPSSMFFPFPSSVLVYWLAGFGARPLFAWAGCWSILERFCSILMLFSLFRGTYPA